MPKCIYCLKNKASSEFNKDHVMPDSFGSFLKTFTLVETVCKECNSYFGDTLELFLGRDTYEGLLRYEKNIKAPKDFKKFNNQRLRFRLFADSDFDGLIMELKYSEEQQKIVAIKAKQVGFKHKGTGKYKFFTFEEIRPRQELEEEGFIIKGEDIIKIYNRSDKKERAEIEEVLHNNDIGTINNKDVLLELDIDGENIDIEIEGTIDSIIYRGIAKIAFNYLAYIRGKDYALSDNFNGIRNYIRFGHDNGIKYVFPQNEPFLYDEKNLGVQLTDGHMITLGWHNHPLKKVILSGVTLFNWVQYKVVLCHWYNGIYYDISAGHHFNIESKVISNMKSIPRNILL